MLELLEQMIATLTADATLTAIVPATNIMVGPVDIVTETQAGQIEPQINLRIVGESQRSVPTGARDTRVQIDVWSRNSQLELEQAYEALINALSYKSGNTGTAHVSWQRLGGAIDLNETERRIWHRAVTYDAWSQKPY